MSKCGWLIEDKTYRLTVKKTEEQLVASNILHTYTLHCEKQYFMAVSVRWNKCYFSSLINCLVRHSHTKFCAKLNFHIGCHILSWRYYIDWRVIIGSVCQSGDYVNMSQIVWQLQWAVYHLCSITTYVVCDWQMTDVSFLSVTFCTCVSWMTE